MPAIPQVDIVLNDNGAQSSITVPQQNVQLVIGCAVGGTVNQPYATSNPGSLQTQFIGGDLVEAGGMVCQAGNIVVGISAPITTLGAVLAPGELTGATSGGNDPGPDVITKTAHGLATGDVVTIASMTTDTAANGTWVITVTGANTFTIPTAGSGSPGTGGTITPTGVTASVPGGSTSTISITLDSVNGAWSQYYVKLRCLTGGTVGTAGIVVQVSLDAGRNWGSPISLGTSTSLYLGQGSLSSPAAGGTGIQLGFGMGTMVAGDSWQFSTTPPLWNDAGVEAALTAYYASQYAVAGVGSIHIVGVCGSTDLADIQTSLQGATSSFIFQRAICELRDASPPAAWGGTGETEATWIAALATLVSGTTAPRIDADGGHYNMPSAYANSAGGLPSYRRPLAWAHAVRRTGISLKRRAGRVKDGPYQQITVNPATDPTDGFIYHDERVNPGLNAARIGSAMTWPGKGQGFFQCQEPLLSANGSQFTELAIGNVLDVACDIGYQEGVEFVSDDLLLQQNGTLDPIQLNTMQAEIQSGLNEGMIQTPLVSDVTAIVSPTQNVAATGIVPITINVTPDGYVNAVSETINLNYGT